VGAREEVLVVPRDALFAGNEWAGFRDTDLAELLTRVRASYRFRPRREVEDDASEPQIIPYVIFRHDDRYFLTHRLRRSSERRLRHLYSLGVGGHINPEDVAGAADPIEAGLQREWQEEVVYGGQFSTRLLGAINDQTTPVGRVHVTGELLDGRVAERRIAVQVSAGREHEQGSPDCGVPLGLLDRNLLPRDEREDDTRHENSGRSALRHGVEHVGNDLRRLARA